MSKKGILAGTGRKHVRWNSQKRGETYSDDGKSLHTVKKFAQLRKRHLWDNQYENVDKKIADANPSYYPQDRLVRAIRKKFRYKKSDSKAQALDKRRQVNRLIVKADKGKSRFDYGYIDPQHLVERIRAEYRDTEDYTSKELLDHYEQSEKENSVYGIVNDYNMTDGRGSIDHPISDGKIDETMDFEFRRPVIGNKTEVYNGDALITPGGLTVSMLTTNAKTGKVVSKKKQKAYQIQMRDADERELRGEGRNGPKRQWTKDGADSWQAYLQTATPAEVARRRQAKQKKKSIVRAQRKLLKSDDLNSYAFWLQENSNENNDYAERLKYITESENQTEKDEETKTRKITMRLHNLDEYDPEIDTDPATFAKALITKWLAADPNFEQAHTTASWTALDLALMQLYPRAVYMAIFAERMRLNRIVWDAERAERNNSRNVGNLGALNQLDPFDDDEAPAEMTERDNARNVDPLTANVEDYGDESLTGVDGEQALAELGAPDSPPIIISDDDNADFYNASLNAFFRADAANFEIETPTDEDVESKVEDANDAVEEPEKIDDDDDDDDDDEEEPERVVSLEEFNAEKEKWLSKHSMPEYDPSDSNFAQKLFDSWLEVINNPIKPMSTPVMYMANNLSTATRYYPEDVAEDLRAKWSSYFLSRGRNAGFRKAADDARARARASIGTGKESIGGARAKRRLNPVLTRAEDDEEPETEDQDQPDPPSVALEDYVRSRHGDEKTFAKAMVDKWMAADSNFLEDYYENSPKAVIVHGFYHGDTLEEIDKEITRRKYPPNQARIERNRAEDAARARLKKAKTKPKPVKKKRKKKNEVIADAAREQRLRDQEDQDERNIWNFKDAKLKAAEIAAANVLARQQKDQIDEKRRQAEIRLEGTRLKAEYRVLQAREEELKELKQEAEKEKQNDIKAAQVYDFEDEVRLMDQEEAENSLYNQAVSKEASAYYADRFITIPENDAQRATENVNEQSEKMIEDMFDMKNRLVSLQAYNDAETLKAEWFKRRWLSEPEKAFISEDILEEQDIQNEELVNQDVPLPPSYEENKSKKKKKSNKKKKKKKDNKKRKKTNDVKDLSEIAFAIKTAVANIRGRGKEEVYNSKVAQFEKKKISKRKRLSESVGGALSVMPPPPRKKPRTMAEIKASLERSKYLPRSATTSIKDRSRNAYSLLMRTDPALARKMMSTTPLTPSLPLNPVNRSSTSTSDSSRKPVHSGSGPYGSHSGAGPYIVIHNSAQNSPSTGAPATYAPPAVSSAPNITVQPASAVVPGNQIQVPPTPPPPPPTNGVIPARDTVRFSDVKSIEAAVSISEVNDALEAYKKANPTDRAEALAKTLSTVEKALAKATEELQAATIVASEAKETSRKLSESLHLTQEEQKISDASLVKITDEIKESNVKFQKLVQNEADLQIQVNLLGGSSDALQGELWTKVQAYAALKIAYEGKLAELELMEAERAEIMSRVDALRLNAQKIGVINQNQSSQLESLSDAAFTKAQEFTIFRQKSLEIEVNYSKTWNQLQLVSAELAQSNTRFNQTIRSFHEGLNLPGMTIPMADDGDVASYGDDDSEDVAPNPHHPNQKKLRKLLQEVDDLDEKKLKISPELVKSITDLKQEISNIKHRKTETIIVATARKINALKQSTENSENALEVYKQNNNADTKLPERVIELTRLGQQVQDDLKKQEIAKNALERQVLRLSNELMVATTQNSQNVIKTDGLLNALTKATTRDEALGKAYGEMKEQLANESHLLQLSREHVEKLNASMITSSNLHNQQVRELASQTGLQHKLPFGAKDGTAESIPGHEEALNQKEVLKFRQLAELLLGLAKTAAKMVIVDSANTAPLSDVKILDEMKETKDPIQHREVLRQIITKAEFSVNTSDSIEVAAEKKKMIDVLKRMLKLTEKEQNFNNPAILDDVKKTVAEVKDASNNIMIGRARDAKQSYHDARNYILSIPQPVHVAYTQTDFKKYRDFFIAQLEQKLIIAPKKIYTRTKRGRDGKEGYFDTAGNTVSNTVTATRRNSIIDSNDVDSLTSHTTFDTSGVDATMEPNPFGTRSTSPSSKKVKIEEDKHISVPPTAAGLGRELYGSGMNMESYQPGLYGDVYGYHMRHADDHVDPYRYYGASLEVSHTQADW